MLASFLQQYLNISNAVLVYLVCYTMRHRVQGGRPTEEGTDERQRQQHQRKLPSKVRKGSDLLGEAGVRRGKEKTRTYEQVAEGEVDDDFSEQE